LIEGTGNIFCFAVPIFLLFGRMFWPDVEASFAALSPASLLKCMSEMYI
jgi:hypothetical protein